MRIWLFILFIMTAGCLLTACHTAERTGTGNLPTQITPTKEYYPTDLEDAMIQLDRLIGEEERNRVIKKTESQMIEYHFNLGLWMRNSWLRPKASTLKKYFNQLGVDNPDDMSGIILTSYWRKLHGKAIDLETQVVVAIQQAN